jgi:hypothetical protein
VGSFAAGTWENPILSGFDLHPEFLPENASFDEELDSQALG